MCILYCAPAHSAPPPGDFSASVARPATWQASAYRGETVAISAQLTGSDGKPFPVPEGASASMLWSTNGVDWFEPRPATVTTGGLIRATWTPDMDVGADSYRIFLRVDDGGTSNINYRANMLLRMLGSPGAVPGELPLPVKTIDFAAVAVSNAPWIETETDPTVPAWAKAENPPPAEESDPVFAEWAGTNAYVRAESDPLGRFALRRTLAETNSASWTIIPGEGVEVLGDGRVVAFTNEYVEAGEGFAVRSFDIVPAEPGAAVPVDAEIAYDFLAGPSAADQLLGDEPEIAAAPTGGALRVEVALARGERRYRVRRCVLSVRSLSLAPADMAGAWPDDLAADDYAFRDPIGETTFGGLRQWAAGEFAAKSAERWWRTPAGGGVSLEGNALALGRGQFAQTLSADATNVVLIAGGQTALRVVDGYGLGAADAEWRISRIRCAGGNDAVTLRCTVPGAWRDVALYASRDAREWEETGIEPTIDGGDWTYLVPTNSGWRFYKAAGTLVAHPESRVETDFSISALGDVTASNGLHRLSAKADASALAGYSPTGHVHAPSDISGVAAQTWVFTLTNGVAVTKEVLVREVAE